VVRRALRILRIRGSHAREHGGRGRGRVRKEVGLALVGRVAVVGHGGSRGLIRVDRRRVVDVLRVDGRILGREALHLGVDLGRHAAGTAPQVPGLGKLRRGQVGHLHEARRHGVVVACKHTRDSV
jgi:hypothetical protein